MLILNICGGEPTLREDLPDICRLAVEHLSPNIIHFPTNCLSPELIEKQVEAILKVIPVDIKFIRYQEIEKLRRKEYNSNRILMVPLIFFHLNFQWIFKGALGPI